MVENSKQMQMEQAEAPHDLLDDAMDDMIEQVVTNACQQIQKEVKVVERRIPKNNS